jgi:hypothetical protein
MDSGIERELLFRYNEFECGKNYISFLMYKESVYKTNRSSAADNGGEGVDGAGTTYR